MEQTLNLEQPAQQPGLVERVAGRLHRSRWSNATGMGLLFLLALLPYLNTLRNGFVYDDEEQVLSNPYIRDFHHLREIFTTDVLSYQGFSVSANYYRPMMKFGYLLCFRVFGPRAYGFHLVNLLLHGFVVVLQVQMRRAVALAPLDVKARAVLGKLYLTQRRLSEAEEQFRRFS